MCGPKPKIISLTIGATTASPFPPTLADDGGFTSITEPADKKTTTLVSPGNIMIWKMSEDIISIKIVEKEGQDIFSINPAPQPDGTWQATVGKFPKGNTREYDIIYTVKDATGNPYTQDPKIKMNT
jgi:hypothetical protein